MSHRVLDRIVFVRSNYALTEKVFFAEDTDKSEDENEEEEESLVNSRPDSVFQK